MASFSSSLYWFRHGDATGITRRTGEHNGGQGSRWSGAGVRLLGVSLGDTDRIQLLQEPHEEGAFPECPIRDIPDDDPIFHSVYDLNDRYQVPGQTHLRDGYKSNNGESARGAHWRAIYDEHGRAMVAISYNSDLRDAWEYADDAWYPARFADLSIRTGVNYILYAMTH